MAHNTEPQRRVQNFFKLHGRVQIVEISEGRCHVGYLPSDGSGRWRYWGLGEGGFDATVARFSSKLDFQPANSEE